MDRLKLIELLSILNANDPADCTGDLNVLCEINVSEACKRCDIDIETVTQLVKEIHSFNQDDYSTTWKYICLNFHLLLTLKDSLDDSPPTDVLSVQQSKTLKTVFGNIIGVGICCNLQPNMPKYRELPTEYVDENRSVLNSYNRLAGTTHGVIMCLKCLKLRSVTLAENFKTVLSSLYQIAYCPLKKPTANQRVTDFVMTQDVYDRLLRERTSFRLDLDYLASSVHKNFYVRETMTLLENSSPMWLKKSISQNLSTTMRSPNGIETIVCAMLESTVDYDPNDSSKTWKIFDIVTKLIMNFHAAADFKENICQQVLDLLKLKDRDGNTIKPFESIYVLCAKRLYTINGELCKSVLLPAVVNPFTYLTTYDHKFQNDEDITDVVIQAIILTHSCTTGNDTDDPNLPIELFTPVINVIFRLYSVTVTSSLNIVTNELQDIMVKYLECGSRVFVAFDTFLFDMQNEQIRKVRDDLYLEVKGESLIIKKTDHRIKTSVSKMGDALMTVCKNRKNLLVSLFLYLLNCLNDREKYFAINTNKDLLDLETNFVVDEAIERNLMVYQLLSSLAEDKDIQKHISENPVDVIKYVESDLRKTLDSKLHITTEFESETFQTVFTTIMILQALVMNSSKENLWHYRNLLDLLRTLRSETTNAEFKTLVSSVINILTDKHDVPVKFEEVKTEFDAAMEDVCDSLLPVRGHGLMALTKLVEKRDKDAMERRQYILNIFQQNLKNDDSFIYLSSIGGLAAMGDVFPDIVVKILAEEYSDFTKKDSEDGIDLRMKLGEVLVRVTKGLGEMAPKYKSVLLNCFLASTKDDDHLIRASSLSNLGEICRVLGYKLGTIVTEVLVCVHAVITTDKAVEARRAAVTVTRQLFAGLESEMIAFLKDDILQIYRTLKNIYHNDRDDVMRLQAQLALEELNANMRNFVSPSPQLNTEKKIFMLD